VRFPYIFLNLILSMLAELQAMFSGSTIAAGYLA
jgi:hypothetical protein